jgi:hypothetical protein
LILWSYRHGEFEGILASHILLSQKPDPKDKQVINLDQDVHVSGYFWWMVYGLLLLDHFSLFFLFFWDLGYHSFSFLFLLLLLLSLFFIMLS